MPNKFVEEASRQTQSRQFKKSLFIPRSNVPGRQGWRRNEKLTCASLLTDTKISTISSIDTSGSELNWTGKSRFEFACRGRWTPCFIHVLIKERKLSVPLSQSICCNSAEETYRSVFRNDNLPKKDQNLARMWRVSTETPGNK
ncbi:hypothetical protein CDAR_548801 [Caerostris darwini]|uniref:Uncharacterized protein n=1 Tax=Caerostris darwini TaxID=1538125 RepID=A0AAV4WJN1_9ARAC|nr:hypothetical protein CDAR_548801 [Caerostris darwini]